MYLLRCAVQNYEWGRPAATSIVARLKQLNERACSQAEHVAQAETDAQKPFAEFWMGAHKNGPNFILLDEHGSKKEMLLSEYLASNQGALGEAVLRQFGGQAAGQTGGETVQLPFLFKVLSVNKALSIQIHPDKPTARELRERFPNLYPDDNHKPEMAIAIGEFECMCAFRPASEIAGFLQTVSELRGVIGEPQCDAFCKAAQDASGQEGGAISAALSDCFKALMCAQADVVAEALQRHLKRIGDKRAEGEALSTEEALIERLFGAYGADVGCFVVYFLNVIRLRDGEAVFLGANLPHCYLFGDCVELMACSDNVVRAGLTPKHRDVETLCRLVDCSPRAASTVRFEFAEERRGAAERRSYVPPVDDFALERYRVSRQALHDDDADVQIAAAKSASIVLVLNGDCVLEAQRETETATDSHKRTLFAHAGTCLFVPAGTALQVRHKLNVAAHREQPDRDAFWHVEPDSVMLFRAFCNHAL